MRISLGAATVVAVMSGSASAAPLYIDDLLEAQTASINGAFILVQQISIPIVINQALAIGIMSENVHAFAEANVTSINLATTFVDGYGEATTFFGGAPGGMEGLPDPLLLSDLELGFAEQITRILEDIFLALELPVDGPVFNPGETPGEEPLPAVPVPPALPLAAAAMASLCMLGGASRRKA